MMDGLCIENTQTHTFSVIGQHKYSIQPVRPTCPIAVLLTQEMKRTGHSPPPTDPQPIEVTIFRMS
ncbi:MAG TPA: hypothetical protein VH500_08845 [Nitrososphaeraceae archaeon]|jgi:hypothetical protein